jgi:hypothetical protein
MIGSFGMSAELTDPVTESFADLIDFTILDPCDEDPVYLTLTAPDIFVFSVIDPYNTDSIALVYDIYDPYSCTFHHDYSDVVATVEFEGTDLSDYVWFDDENTLILEELTYFEVESHFLTVTIVYPDYPESASVQTFELSVVCDDES